MRKNINRYPCEWHRPLPGKLRLLQLAATGRIPSGPEIRDNTDADARQTPPRFVESRVRGRALFRHRPQHDPLPQAREEPRSLGAFLHHDRPHRPAHRGLQCLYQVWGECTSTVDLNNPAVKFIKPTNKILFWLKKKSKQLLKERYKAR